MNPINIKRKLLEQLLKQNKKIQINIRGNSMKPLLENGERITIIPADKLREGDIVLWARENGLAFLVHRIIVIYGKMYITKGDNLETFDYPITREDIIGKYRSSKVCMNLFYKLKAKSYKTEGLQILKMIKYS